MSIFSKIEKKQAKISVIGLGYVGLPIALEFAKKYSVIGFDIKPDRVVLMQKGQDPSKEVATEDFIGRDIEFTADAAKLAEAHFHIIAVPTPIDDYKQPDLNPLLGACRSVGKYLKTGDYVLFESTVYPGCTEEDCVPILEQESGLELNQDFKVGFSPERINPGDKVNTLTSITKIVSGSDAESLAEIAKVYSSIIKAGIHKAPSIKVAEAAKIIENSQRDINIAFMNELSIIFNKMGINTYEVLEAAGTKWNFLKFYPGLVGGHCIGVDPYYLTHKARELGYHAQIINSGRFINDSMGGYVAKELVKMMLTADKDLKNCKVLVMGITFKENVSDIRNSKVVDLVRELRSYRVEVEVVDPLADSDEVKQEYGFSLSPEIGQNYDAVIIAVNHQQYSNLPESYFTKITAPDAVFVDIKGIYRNKISRHAYWSL